MKEALKILMVEDAESDAQLELHELRRAELVIDVRRVETEEDFRRALLEFQPHIILSDCSMPAGFDGLTALDLAREQAPDVPFVFVSGTIGEDRVVEAMRRGARDYVFKDRLDRLVPVVQRALQEADERAARRRAELWRDGQNRLLELVATGASLADTLSQLMLTVESQAAGMLCSILLLDAQGVHLRIGAAPTLPDVYNRAVDGVAIGPAAGSCGTAAYRKEQVIVTDIATDPLWESYRELAAAHGLRACWSTPILTRDGNLLGTFANYFRTPRGPTPAELGLVASATHIARIAIEKRRDEAEILRAKERLDLALEASGVALWDNDILSGRIYFSEHWARLLQDEPRETAMTVPEMIRLAHPDDRRTLHEAARDTIRGRRASYYTEARVMAKNGEWKWILSRGKVVERSADGHALRVIGTTVDITERKLQEQRIARLSRIHAALSGISSVIVRTRDRQELFDEACRIAVEYCEFGFAWIGTYDAEKLEITPVASAGLPSDSELRSSKLLIRPDAPQRGSVAVTAIRERRLVYNNDIIADADPGNDRRQEAIRRGYRSAVALPLIVNGEVYGNFSLNAKEPDFFDEDERKLLTKLADDISFALEHLASQEKLEYLSYYDTLTGLPNRTLFIDRTGQQLRGRGGEALVVAVILVNLDRFRNINESFGRHSGDELLKRVARRLEDAFRGKDYLARIGADAFGVVIRGSRDAAAVIRAVEDQVLGCFAEPFRLHDTELRVAARAGIAMFPADGADADTLFKNAEAALKKARDSGERYLFYAADMNAQAAHALSLETRLRKAVEEQQFVLHYQPKIDLASDTICGMEALIRWNDPESGLVPPLQFIPLLEETGMILDVGRWAIQHALSQHREWSISGLRPPRIAVNVSAIQLQQRDFAEMVIAAVRQAGDNPAALGIEITESLLMKDVQASIRKLSILRGLDIEIAMDDFGTGYSSLSYIARLPISSLKIDRSFVNDMGSGPQDMAIVTTIIVLAHSLDLKVVAEGVETEEQAKLLARMKCDEAQGFLYSRPLSAANIEPLLRAAAHETPLRARAEGKGQPPPRSARPRPAVKRVPKRSARTRTRKRG